MSFSLILDLIVVALLVPTIIYAVILNNRLATLRKNREELARLIAAFNEATNRAETGIPRLRKISEEAAKGVQEKVTRAQVLRDDLAFMVERAEGMANRLEEAVRAGRAEVKAASGAAALKGGAGQRPIPAAAGADIESAAEAAERAEAESRKRLEATGGGRGPDRDWGGGPAAPSQPSRTVPPAPPRGGGRPLGAALAADAGLTDGEGGLADDDRSEAERELLRALQSAR